MGHFIVFAGRKWRNAYGKGGITWDIAGVWEASSAEQACLIAAQKQGVGTCFAIEGFAWGVDLVSAGDVTEVGVQLDPIERLERMGQRLGERIAQALPAAQHHELDEGGNE